MLEFIGAELVLVAARNTAVIAWAIGGASAVYLVDALLLRLRA